MTWIAPRDTIEGVPLDITRNGEPLASGFTVAIFPNGTQPSPADYKAPVTLDGTPHAWVEGLTPGYWQIRVKIDATPEQPTIDAGTILIT